MNCKYVRLHLEQNLPSSFLNIVSWKWVKLRNFFYKTEYRLHETSDGDSIECQNEWINVLTTDSGNNKSYLFLSTEIGAWITCDCNDSLLPLGIDLWYRNSKIFSLPSKQQKIDETFLMEFRLGHRRLIQPIEQICVPSNLTNHTNLCQFHSNLIAV